MRLTCWLFAGDLLTRTDVSAGDIVQKEATNNPTSNEQPGDEVTSNSMTTNNPDVTGSPNRLNRKQRRKQVQEKSSENMTGCQVLKSQSDVDKINYTQTSDQRPTSFDKSLESGPRKSSAPMKEPSFVPTTLDGSGTMGKSIGVIGSPLPGASSQKPSAPVTHAVATKAEAMVQGLVNPLDMNSFAPSQIPHLMMQNNMHSSAPHLHPFAAPPANIAHPMQQVATTSFAPVAQSMAQSQDAAKLQYLIQQQQQQQLAQMRVTSSQSLAHNDALRQHFQQAYTVNSQLSAAGSNVHSTMPSQAFMPSDLSGDLPPAPQKSKLHQWTQPQSKDETAIDNHLDQSTSSWNTKGVVSSNASPASSMGAPVTVDPVSAKWGVLAAPRLSPTPCEFKPGVPWKPKADRRPEDDDRDNAKAEEEQPDLRGFNDLKRDSDMSVPVSTVRPPPGLSSVNMFGMSSTHRPGSNVGYLEARTTEAPAAAKTGGKIRQWLSLLGLKPSVSV